MMFKQILPANAIKEPMENSEENMPANIEA